MIQKDSLKAVLYCSLAASDIEVKPYCIRSTAYDALYLPSYNTILPIDLVDDSDRRSPNNPVLQNNLAARDGLDVFRIRSMDCTPKALDSFDYYLEDFNEATVSALIAYLLNEFGGQAAAPALPDIQDSIKAYQNAVADYDAFYTSLCVSYAEETGRTSLRLKEQHRNEYIGVWLHFKGDFFIPYKDKHICSRSQSIGASMEDAHRKGQQSANQNLDAQWMEQYKELQRYYEQNGHSNAPQSVGSLGRWVRRQRTAYKGGRLPEYRIQLLDVLEFDWNPTESIRQSWDDNFRLLLQYRDEFGTLNVPQKEKYQGKALGTWLAKQRLLHRKGALEPEREAKLTAAGLEWDPASLRH